MSEFEGQKDIEVKEGVTAASGSEQEEDTSLANSDVTTKYKEAAKIVNATMLEVIALVSEPLECHTYRVLLSLDIV